MKRITAATASLLGTPRCALSWQQAAVALPAGRLALHDLKPQRRDSATFAHSVTERQ